MQRNVVCEMIYLTVTNSLQSIIYSNPPNNMAQENVVIDKFLSVEI